MANFGDTLADAVKRRGNPVVVGLDPRWEQLPPSMTAGQDVDITTKALAYEKFCREVIDVVAPLVPAIKPQLAFFEELGPAGLAGLANVVAYGREQGLLVIMDGKRNDIGSTAEAYARGYLGRGQSAWQCDAITVSPYLGADSLDPFIEVAHERAAGLFVLVKTSNPGSHMLQNRLVDGQPLCRIVADYVEKQCRNHAGVSGYGNVGAVVGATYPVELEQLRLAMRHAWLLVPGYGSQGGTAKDVTPAFDENGLGAVINNSRGIIFAHTRREYKDHFGESRWQDAAAAATEDMIDQLRAETPAGKLMAS